MFVMFLFIDDIHDTLSAIYCDYWGQIPSFRNKNDRNWISIIFGLTLLVSQDLRAICTLLT